MADQRFTWLGGRTCPNGTPRCAVGLHSVTDAVFFNVTEQGRRGTAIMCVHHSNWFRYQRSADVDSSNWVFT